MSPGEAQRCQGFRRQARQAAGDSSAVLCDVVDTVQGYKMAARGGRTMCVDVTLDGDDESISPAAPSALSPFCREKNFVRTGCTAPLLRPRRDVQHVDIQRRGKIIGSLGIASHHVAQRLQALLGSTAHSYAQRRQREDEEEGGRGVPFTCTSRATHQQSLCVAQV
jgi:hypothetical protein